jgi:Flp pilus assembly protein TadD
VTDPTAHDAETALCRGDADDALRLGIDCLRRDRRDVAALTVCYRAYLARDDRPNATKVLEIIVDVAPESGWARAALGGQLYASGELDRAEAVLRAAVEADPANAAAHARLGTVFSELNRLAAGEWHFRRALELGGDDADVLTDLGLNLTRQERGDEADACYARALELEPRNLRTLGYRARLKEVRGDLDAAGELLRRADAVQPGGVSLLEASLASRTVGAGEALAALGRSPRLNGDALLERARLKDLTGDYAGAWQDAVDAKRELAREGGGLRYDAPGVESFFADLAAVFDRAFIAAMPRAPRRGDMPQPLFIVGAPRSGTTLLERMLASHSAVRAGGELPFVADLREFSERLLPGRSFPSNLHALHAADCRHVAMLFRDYYLALRAERGAYADGVRFVTDKMPFNEVYLPLIRMAFPDCPVVFLVRDRLDTAVSMLFNKLNHGFHCAYRIDDIFHHLDAVRGLVEHYRQQFDPGILALEYESLVADADGALRRILDYAGLDFEPACLRFYEDDRFVATPSYSQVGRPITSGAIGRHRHYLDFIGKFGR